MVRVHPKTNSLNVGGWLDLVMKMAESGNRIAASASCADL